MDNISLILSLVCTSVLGMNPSIYLGYYVGASLVAQMAKNLPAMQETRVQSLGQEDPLEKKMATQSSILAWEIPWKRNLVGYSSWGRKELDMTKQLA